MRRTHQDDPDGPTPNAPRAGEPATGRRILGIGARGRRSLGAVALAALVLGAAYIVSKPGSGTPTANGTAAASSFEEIESFVQDEMAAQRIPGLALGIVEGDRIAYVRGFGRADDSGNHVVAALKEIPVMRRLGGTIGHYYSSLTRAPGSACSLGVVSGCRRHVSEIHSVQRRNVDTKLHSRRTKKGRQELFGFPSRFYVGNVLP